MTSTREMPTKEEMETFAGEDVRLVRTELTDNEKCPELETQALHYGEGEHFRNEIRYDIAAVKNIWHEEEETLEETDEKVKVGTMKMIVIDTAFEKFGVNPFFFYDSHSQSLLELYEQVLHKYFQPRFIHYLDHIEILPEFRGRQLGLTLLQQYITRYIHEGDLFVTKPFPLQWQGKVNTAVDRIEFNKDMKKLRKFYTNVGLKRFKKTDHYFYEGTEFSVFNQKD